MFCKKTDWIEFHGSDIGFHLGIKKNWCCTKNMRVWITRVKIYKRINQSFVTENSQKNNN